MVPILGQCQWDQRKKRKPHFHKIGLLSSIQSKTPHHQPATEKKKKQKVDSDISYQMSDDGATILDVISPLQDQFTQFPTQKYNFQYSLQDKFVTPSLLNNQPSVFTP